MKNPPRSITDDFVNGLGLFENLGLNGLDMGWTTWPLLRPIQNKVIWEGSESLFAAWLVIPNGLGIWLSGLICFYLLAFRSLFSIDQRSSGSGGWIMWRKIVYNAVLHENEGISSLTYMHHKRLTVANEHERVINWECEHSCYVRDSNLNWTKYLMFS